MSRDTTPTQATLVARPDKTKFGIWLFLGSEVVLFTVLILTFVVDRIDNAADYPAFKEHLSIPLVGLNTLILVASSFLVVRALEAIRHDNQAGLRKNLVAVIVLGALFLAGQGYEWAALFRDEVTPSTPFGAAFFTVTGIHGTHVFIGLIWAGLVLVHALTGAYSSSRQHGVEIFGLYWHFVDIVWIVLFTVIYLF